MRAYNAEMLEEALCRLWLQIEGRLTETDLKDLRIETNGSGVLNELYNYGPDGPAGLGLGRMGGHAIG